MPLMEYDPAGSLEALVTGGEVVLGTGMKKEKTTELACIHRMC